MKIKLIAFFMFSMSVHALETTFKGEYLYSNTDNVNSSNTSLVSDSYQDFSGYVQFKQDKHRLRLKGKVERYKKTSSNNYTSFGLNYNYKESKTQDYTFEIFKLKYSETPTVSTDTTSDNQGGKIATTLTSNFDKDRTGYITFSGTYKNYVNIPTRKDTLVNVLMGYENYVSSDLAITPELNLEYNKSKDSYYTNFNIGPALYLTLNATENLELSLSGTLTYTSYSNRTFDTTVKNRTVTNKEHQTLVVVEFIGTYSFSKNLSLEVRYNTNKNSSNNSSSAYTSKVTSLALGMKF